MNYTCISTNNIITEKTGFASEFAKPESISQSLSSAGFFNICFNLIYGRHHAERALLGSDKRSCRVGKSEQLVKMLFIVKAINAIFKDMQQCACAECIACTGCLNSVGIEETCLINFLAAAVCL